jgi:hypothetical protein
MAALKSRLRPRLGCLRLRGFSLILGIGPGFDQGVGHLAYIPMKKRYDWGVIPTLGSERCVIKVTDNM